MCSYTFSLHVKKASWFTFLPGVQLYYPGIISIWYKTDILAVRFFCVAEALPGRNIPYFTLPHIPQRELDMRQLKLSKHVEDIALVLGLIQTLFEQHFSIFILLYPGIVTGDHIIASQNLCPLEKLVKLHVFITINAWIRGYSLLIAADELIDYLMSEISGKIEYKKIHPQRICHIPGIVHIIKRTACSGARYTSVFIVI